MVKKTIRRLLSQSIEAEIRRAKRNTETGILDGAEPFWLSGGKAACLMIHGFGSSPDDLRSLGKRLNRQGFTVYAPLLPGHGTTPLDLGQTTWKDWFAAVETAYRKLVLDHHPVYVLGYSMGGTLALRLAQLFPIDGLVLLAPFLQITKKWYYLMDPEQAARSSHEFFPYVRKRFPGRINDPIARKNYVSYRHLSVTAFVGALEWVKTVRANLSHIVCPVLIFHAEQDETCDIRGSLELAQKMNASLVVLKRSNHVITHDFERDEVEAETERFLLNCLNQHQDF